MNIVEKYKEMVDGLCKNGYDETSIYGWIRLRMELYEDFVTMEEWDAIVEYIQLKGGD